MQLRGIEAITYAEIVAYRASQRVDFYREFSSGLILHRQRSSIASIIFGKSRPT